jgi:HEAT repeat protein
VNLRGLAYAGDALAQARDALADRFMQFLHGKIAEESPYRNAVMESFSNAVGRARRALADRPLPALRDDSWYVRRKAAEALGKLGAAAPEVTAGLLASLRDTNPYVPRQAAQALERIVEKSSTLFLAGLKQALTANDAQTRQMAVRIIGYYATDQETLQDLQRLPNSPSSWFRGELRAAARDAATRYARKPALFGVSLPND